MEGGTSAGAARPMTAAAGAFDELAAGYDEGFTATAIGTLMREAVWRRLDACFAAGDRVLELNCGTGDDAVHLARRGVRVLATDASAAMLALARTKVESAGLGGSVELRRLAIEELAQLQLEAAAETARPGDPAVPAEPADPARAGGPARPGSPASPGSPGGPGDWRPPFDGALSNFGGLNCVTDLRAAAAGLAACLRPGAVVVLCVMGPLVPWEWAWFVGHGQPARALRRLRPGGARWRGLTIRYPTIGRVRRALAPAFRLRRAAAVGALLPPSYAERWAARHAALLRRLARWERRIETWPPFPWLADHFLLELVRA
jgi:SAM-dependent methyltransferase